MDKEYERCDKMKHIETTTDNKTSSGWTSEDSRKLRQTLGRDRSSPTLGHHESCKKNDIDLVWNCSQCGQRECAEDIFIAVPKLLDRVEALERVVEAAKKSRDTGCSSCFKEQGGSDDLVNEASDAENALEESLSELEGEGGK